jgi:hypothetical protein
MFAVWYVMLSAITVIISGEEILRYHQAAAGTFYTSKIQTGLDTGRGRDGTVG